MLFKSFMNVTQNEIDNFSINEHLEHSIVLNNILEILHAPFLTKT